MTRADEAPSPPRKGELHIVGTSVTREIELLFDQLAEAVGQRRARILQIGSRTSISDRNERNWRSLVGKRFGNRADFVGIDLIDGDNVDRQLDICWPLAKIRKVLGPETFDLVICRHVLEHTQAPRKAADNVQAMLGPGGLVYVATPWSQAFHAVPDDYWRFSMRGLQLLFGKLDFFSGFYSGGDVGLDVAYRIERDGLPALDPSAGAVEQGLFQLVLDHEDNRAVLARQATERLPVSRTYLPTLFVNLLGRRRPK